MYWDVVEVSAEPDYNLFVGFADGVSGRVRIAPETMTGVLAPLLDERFFKKVFSGSRGGRMAWRDRSCAGRDV